MRVAPILAAAALLGAFPVPWAAAQNARTPEELQRQVDELTDRVAKLEAALAALQATSPAAAPPAPAAAPAQASAPVGPPGADTAGASSKVFNPDMAEIGRAHV